MNAHTFVGDESGLEEAQSYIDLIYEVADGFVSVAVMQDKQWCGFAAAVGRPELLQDARFATAELREVNRDARLEAIQEAVATFKTDDLLKRLDAYQVPAAPVLTRTQMRQHPQVERNGIVIETTHPEAGVLRGAGHPVSFSKTPASVRRHAPALGAHTEEVLSEFGRSHPKT